MAPTWAEQVAGGMNDFPALQKIVLASGLNADPKPLLDAQQTDKLLHVAFLDLITALKNSI